MKRPAPDMPAPIPDGLTSEQLYLHILGRDLLSAVMRADREDEAAARRQRQEAS